MKTAIVYYSQHHGNTKKLLDAIAEKHDVSWNYKARIGGK
jgi:flavodoxin